MAFTSGARLGAFEITARIGEGGMGEVYRATDTNLKRQVAIKVLPASVADDADRLARFQREAELLAALNHPNIAAIYGLERTPDVTALVMELVEGDDLSQRIARHSTGAHGVPSKVVGRGAIPFDEALPIAKQIAEALEAAHEQGIIHRDLKPANIKVRADGTVKVLDFGLAKAMDPPAGSSPNVSQSPTITTPAMTQAGMILGTAAYMAPEQARGKAVDRRADIWAFGAVLFEMLTGTRHLRPVGFDLHHVAEPGTATTLPRPIDWLTRDGKTAVLRAADADWGRPRFSPDGRKLAVEIFDGKQRDVWVYEWARDTLTQLTFDPGEDRYPVWTPDGGRLVFASDRAVSGVLNLYGVNADGTGDVTRLTDSPQNQLPWSWHPSGKFLAFHTRAAATVGDLMLMPMEWDAARGWTPGTPTVFLSTPGNEVVPMFSPDGRWIAYLSDESGILDVYVRPFPGAGSKWRISATGGATPRWSATTHELLFLTTDGSTIMAAPYAVVGDSFRAAAPQNWSPASIQSHSLTTALFDLHPDGKRVATAVSRDQGSGVRDKVVFVSNFGGYLRTIAPGPK